MPWYYLKPRSTSHHALTMDPVSEKCTYKNDFCESHNFVVYNLRNISISYSNWFPCYFLIVDNYHFVGQSYPLLGILRMLTLEINFKSNTLLWRTFPAACFLLWVAAIKWLIEGKYMQIGTVSVFIWFSLLMQSMSQELFMLFVLFINVHDTMISDVLCA